MKTFEKDSAPLLFSNALDKIHEEYKRGDIPAANTIYSAVLCLKNYLQARTYLFGDESFDSEWLVHLVEKHLGSQLSTTDKAVEIGALIEGLIIYGSSKNQALDAVSDWLIISRTKARSAHLFYCKINGPRGTTRDFSSYDGGVLFERFFFIEKPFPSQYPKALEAFKKLKLACKEPYDESQSAIQDFLKFIKAT